MNKLLNLLQNNYSNHGDSAPLKEMFSSDEYEDLSKCFTSEYDSNVFKQYYSVFLLRLNQMTDPVMKAIKKKWNKIIIRENIQMIKGTEKQIIFGILYKEMRKKPNILNGVESILESRYTESFIDNNDICYLEDRNGRIRIHINTNKCPDISTNSLISGVPIGLW